MRYYSTKNKNRFFSFRDAVLKGLPDDNGLFMPEHFSSLPEEFLKIAGTLSLPELAYGIIKDFVEHEIPETELKRICAEAFNFPVPLVQLDEQTFIAELFHGPTLAFKDFGARFMARIMSFLNRGESKKLSIIVATSGDTGGAVADGFSGVEGIEVFILYPSGGVSELQEKQLTTYGGNIRAIEVEGTFDDCQRLAKSAFLDKELSSRYRLSSANSINISRLLPQMVYYFSSRLQFPLSQKIAITVPSGNFGNLTAGLFAKRIGLPVDRFVAATNVNDTVPLYLAGKGFHPHASRATISNAMDVGNPSNFGRMLDMYGDSFEQMKKDISSISITDAETEEEMKRVYKAHGYISDPHGAVGIAGWRRFVKENPGYTGIVLETAHPAKFIETVERVLGMQVKLPKALESLRSRNKVAGKLNSDFNKFKEYLLSV